MPRYLKVSLIFYPFFKGLQHEYHFLILSNPNRQIFHTVKWYQMVSLQWRHMPSVSASSITGHSTQLFNTLFRSTPKGTLKLHIIGTLWGKPSLICWFPTQKASNAESFSKSWHHATARAKISIAFSSLSKSHKTERMNISRWQHAMMSLWKENVFPTYI